MSTKHEAAGSIPATITKQAAATRAYVAALSSEERRAHFGRHHSAETKAKMSAGARRYIASVSDVERQRWKASIGKGVMAFLATKPPMLKTCSGCGKQFEATRRTPAGGLKTTCSDDCFLLVKHLNARGDRSIVYNNGVRFDSRWELEIAEWLDLHSIPWERPGPIPWVDARGKAHQYFPDFLLPRCGIYLDPKNPYAIRQQLEKLVIVSKRIRLIYGSVEEIKEAVGRFVCR